MYQVGNPVPDRSGNEQGCHRLFRRIAADRSPCASALLINGGSRLTRLVCDVASDTLDCIYRLDPAFDAFWAKSAALSIATPALSFRSRSTGLA